jgi:hypothetical protein
MDPVLELVVAYSGADELPALAACSRTTRAMALPRLQVLVQRERMRKCLLLIRRYEYSWCGHDTWARPCTADRSRIVAMRYFAAQPSGRHGLDTKQWIDWQYLGKPHSHVAEAMPTTRIRLTRLKPKTREVQSVYVCALWRSSDSRTYSIHEAMVDSCEVAKFYN